jgi:hypothetical protein
LWKVYRYCVEFCLPEKTNRYICGKCTDDN